MPLLAFHLLLLGSQKIRMSSHFYPTISAKEISNAHRL